MCEPWATSHNLGIIPPLKGRSIAYSQETVLNMFERTLLGLKKRVQHPFNDLTKPPRFFDFVFRMVSDYEGREDQARQARYYEAPSGWLSSFSEMYSKISGQVIEELRSVEGAIVMRLTSGVLLRFDGNRIDYGKEYTLENGIQLEPDCRKNIGMEDCTFGFLKSIVIGKQITSAGDFGSYIEFGLDQRFNLGLHENGFHIVSTEMPIEDHQL